MNTMNTIKKTILVAFVLLAVFSSVSAEKKPTKEFLAQDAYTQAITLVNRISNSNLNGKNEAAEEIEAVAFKLLSANRKK